ncbi:hypothetical protein EC9_41520 [Rosistilla ulvae]|uniref:Calcineurin-like phosphoesterase n=1 Tax=Rosistilla ulvae TaxID=1930277 RepID=A0A517M506_9BACT|nr:TIGR00282 family metallophosphoesterase [Rosistilla ulvae]QDS89950.1 hypothetical protein EC9_41520 [Rosistilla ulvae]
MRLLFLGDIVGKPGVQACVAMVPGLRDELQTDLVIVNAENSADGSGLTVKQFQKLAAHGIDAFTMGDHIYRKREITPVLESDPRIVKPANYPPSAPGKTFAVLETQSGVKVAIVSLMGRVYMRPVDCPFAAADRVLAEIPGDVKVRFVDLHAEATSDKQLLGRYLDGRVSAALGTHTHVPTADARILPGGTAFMCDVGMSGAYDSIIGREIDPVMQTTLTFTPTYFHVASKDVRLCGAVIDIDPKTGKATAIERFERSWNGSA